MAKLNRLDELVHGLFHFQVRQAIRVLLEVLQNGAFHELKYEVQTPLASEHLDQIHNVDMLELLCVRGGGGGGGGQGSKQMEQDARVGQHTSNTHLENSNFAKRRLANLFIFITFFKALDGHDLARFLVAGLEDDSIRADCAHMQGQASFQQHGTRTRTLPQSSAGFRSCPCSN